MPHSPLEGGKVRDWRRRALRIAAALPQMKAPCSGHIINVRSAVHAATKTAPRDLRRPATGGQALQHPPSRRVLATELPDGVTAPDVARNLCERYEVSRSPPSPLPTR
jgi:hypothetical protein